MKFKKLTSVFLAVLLCICTLSADVSAKEKEFETAHEAVANMHAGINIGNTLDSCDIYCDWYANDGVNPSWDENHQGHDPESYETAWGNPPITKEYVKAIKDAGFDSVRLPVTWGNHADKNGNIDKSWLDRVQEVVDMIIEQDMYCMIDMHHDNGWIADTKENYNKNKKRFTKIWQIISNRFKDYDERLIFETYNEVSAWIAVEELDKAQNENKYFGWQPKGADYIEWHNKWMQLFVDTVRKTGGNNRWRNLVIPTYCASIGTGPNGDAQKTPEVFDLFRLPADKYDDHLIIDIHYYSPTSFCFPDSDNDPQYATSEWGSKYDVWKIKSEFAYMDTLQKKTGAPIVIGEYGAVYKNNDDEVVEYIEAYITNAQKYGIATYWWDPINTVDGGTYIWWWDRATYKEQDFGIFNRSDAKVGWTEAADALILYSYKGKLPAPILKGTQKGNSVTLEWNDLSGAYGYRIYEYDAKLGKYKQITFITGNKKTIKGLSKGTHKYKVVPVAKYNDKNKNGSSSNAVKVDID